MAHVDVLPHKFVDRMRAPCNHTITEALSIKTISFFTSAQRAISTPDFGIRGIWGLGTRFCSWISSTMSLNGTVSHCGSFLNHFSEGDFEITYSTSVQRFCGVKNIIIPRFWQRHDFSSISNMVEPPILPLTPQISFWFRSFGMERLVSRRINPLGGSQMC